MPMVYCHFLVCYCTVLYVSSLVVIAATLGCHSRPSTRAIVSHLPEGMGQKCPWGCRSRGYWRVDTGTFVGLADNMALMALALIPLPCRLSRLTLNFRLTQGQAPRKKRSPLLLYLSTDAESNEILPAKRAHAQRSAYANGNVCRLDFVLLCVQSTKRRNWTADRPRP